MKREAWKMTTSRKDTQDAKLSDQILTDLKPCHN